MMKETIIPHSLARFIPQTPKCNGDLQGHLSPLVFRLISTGSLLPSIQHIQGLHLIGFESIRKFWSLPLHDVSQCPPNDTTTSSELNYIELNYRKGNGSSIVNPHDSLPFSLLALYRCSIDLINGVIYYSISRYNNNTLVNEMNSLDLEKSHWSIIVTDDNLNDCMNKFREFFTSISRRLQSFLSPKWNGENLNLLGLTPEEFFGLDSPSITNIIKSEYSYIKTLPLLQCGFDLASGKNPFDMSILTTPDNHDEAFNEISSEIEQSFLNSAIIDVRQLNRTHRARM